MGTIITTVGAVRRATRAILAESFGTLPASDYNSVRRRSSGSVTIEYEDPAVPGDFCQAEVFYRVSGEYHKGDWDMPEEFPQIDVIGAFCDGVPVKLSGPVIQSAIDKAYDAEDARLQDTEY